MQRSVHVVFLWLFWVLLCGLASATACQRASSSAAILVPGTPAAPRRVEVTVSNQGYTPARIPGKPGESLTLVFKYQKSAGECGREVMVPSTDPGQAQPTRIALSEDKPTEVALTLPANKGEVGFTCGMSMLRGAVVVE